jgi:hypothetical protein
MAARNVARLVELGEDQRKQLQCFAASRSLPHAQVERWFGLISQRAIRRGSFGSVKDLAQKIDQFVAAYNESCTPFMWQATAESIFEKISRLCDRISGTAH